MKIIFATHNAHKLTEVNQLLGGKFDVVSLTEIGYKQDIEENGNTFVDNALIKAQTIAKHTDMAVFADDSGLEVTALNGAPGVHTARFAGLPVNHAANNQLLLQKLHGITNRSAHFKTVIALVYSNQVHYFEGSIAGHIALQLTGTDGFGYDPLFIPDGYNKSFAQMTLDEKNKISHRGLAIQKLIAFLNQWNPL
ncbi:MAG: RdgB/HAM1 family non-canonical purine NTP pyrophosphatase [Bacteroidia bacterium]|nr:RdgB/HAM1 family non-canonical purine NTP pyrophosphatase [Bacteroidia bacterium]